MDSSSNTLRQSRRIYLAENALASVIFSLGTGSFMAGLLSFMGASAATCALVGAFPQLGCIMQLVSPFLFERLSRRKGAVILCCFGFRFLLGCAGIVPLLFGGAQAAVVPVYLAAFLFAGFVTPGLTQWMMDIAPREGRGRYFARRDILSSAVNASVILLMSTMLDALIAAGRAREGYMLVFGTVLALSVVDAVLLSRIAEPGASAIVRLMPADMLRPFRDKRFCPILVFIVLWFLAQNLSSGFLAVYQLTVLGLDYKLIALMTVVSAPVGMLMSWVWGGFADRYGFKKLLSVGCALMALSNVCWFCLPAPFAWAAPLIQCITTAGNSAYGMSNMNIQYASCPEDGKTAYLGVAAAVSNLVGYVAVLLGAQMQPLLAGGFGREGIPVLFAMSAAGFLICIRYTRRITEV